VVVDRMLRGEIETTRVPRKPARRPAQQIVAMTAMEEWSVSALSELCIALSVSATWPAGTGVDARHAERTLSVG